jgi:hypothetical protein
MKLRKKEMRKMTSDVSCAICSNNVPLEIGKGHWVNIKGHIEFREYVCEKCYNSNLERFNIK